MRDSMRQRSYDWECDVVGAWRAPLMTRAEARELFDRARNWIVPEVHRLHGIYRTTVPGWYVKHRRTGRSSNAGHGRISMVDSHLREAIILHELAHLVQMYEQSLTGWRFIDPGHGPHWLGWYIELLACFGGAGPTDRKALLRSANFYRLRVAPKSAVAQKCMHHLRIAPVRPAEMKPVPLAA